MPWTTPETFTAGQTLTAASMNVISGNLDAIGGAWTDYTPTVAQGATSNISKTVNVARYIEAGKLVIVRVNLSMTGAGTSANNITVSLPVTSAYGGGSGTLVIGEFLYDDFGTATYTGAAQTTSTTTVVMTTSTGGVIGANPNIAVASGDTIRLSLMYEAA